MAAENFTLTQAYVHELYDYNPETGHLISKQYGRPVGQAIGKYLRVEIRGKRYKNHRIIWLWMHGQWPKLWLDHINGDGLDNRICNLRDVSQSENVRSGRRKQNKYGAKGVFWDKARKHFRVEMRFDCKRVNAGRFATLEEAIAASRAMEERLLTQRANM